MIKPGLKPIQQLRLPPLPTIKDIIKLYKLRALKQLSQNFLLDSRITNKIVKAAGPLQGGEVMEVGPGPGGITRSILAKNPSKVILVEKDARFLPALEMLAEAAPCPVSVYRGDVLTFNMEEMFNKELRHEWSERPPNIHLIGNLPFSVATRLIILWLQDISQRKNAWKFGRVPMTLTFQQEVAERMAAPVMTSQRCRLSIMCQNWCHVHHKFNIPGSAFLPKPDVNVGVVHLVPCENPIIDLPFELVEKVVRCVFSFRQKYCVRGVETLFPSGSWERLIPEMMDRAEVNPKSRPFQLTLPEFGRLCHVYAEIIRREPTLARYNNRKAKVEDTEEEEEDDDGAAEAIERL
ncbi:dimethyladenosine transferase 1, mitochondrial [Homalodisca vitripennis]|uniref:dimethyladenosine transferase 1, mitochondrial n=1 Tax=Homalodisca vitripennis TaxID=197043 RepID=UPI001EEA4229|nr:dimethyladenosine transferase 1, mitochondrial [Homalodisca vitripennis]